MHLNEEQLKKNFAKNLADFRKRAGLTQLELAEKLNYSDKSVSKWERGEGLPDLFVVYTIAELFGVTVNDMIGENCGKKPFLFRNKLIVTALAVIIAWLTATVLYVIMKLIMPTFPSWIFFIYAIPASAIVAVVFCYIWWNKLCRFLSVSFLVWSIPTTVTILCNVSGISLLFTVAGVVQVMTVLWFLIKRK